ncbi:MAG: hypothetical protein IPI57_20675 [Candidatus Competibacteraceae bacterium]|nr:hypothetical protein [Candidatus Competibacteraceae bacterium]
MIILHKLNEDALETAYWAFDTERKRNGMERDAFKHQMRKFARDTLNKAGAQHTVEVDNV